MSTCAGGAGVAHEQKQGPVAVAADQVADVHWQPTPITLYPNHRSAARLQALLGSGPGGDLGAGGEAEFGEDAFDVALGGAWGDDQLGGDLLAGQALGDQLGDL